MSLFFRLELLLQVFYICLCFVYFHLAQTDIHVLSYSVLFQFYCIFHVQFETEFSNSCTFLCKACCPLSVFEAHSVILLILIQFCCITLFLIQAAVLRVFFHFYIVVFIFHILKFEL